MPLRWPPRLDQWLMLAFAVLLVLHALWLVGAWLASGQPEYRLPGLLPVGGRAGVLLIACSVVVGLGLAVSALRNLRLLRP